MCAMPGVEADNAIALVIFFRTGLLCPVSGR
nr:MAG TPA: hypothetical protein [Caudoviricetes sp.]